MGPDPKMPATINMVRPKLEAQAFPGVKASALPNIPQIQSIAQGSAQYNPLNLGFGSNQNKNLDLLKILFSAR